MSLERWQKAYTTRRQGLKPEHVIPAPVKSFSGIRSVWTGEDEEKKPFPLRNDGWGTEETGQAGPLWDCVTCNICRAQGMLQALGLSHCLPTTSVRLWLP